MNNIISFCAYCQQSFQSDLLSDFCCQEHSKLYWENPVEVEITSTCPQCKKEFSRMVYSVSMFAWQAFAMCPNCSSEKIMFVGYNNE